MKPVADINPVANTLPEAGLSDSETGDLLGVALVPSAEGGTFEIEDRIYGSKCVGKILLLGLDKKDISSMHNKGVFPIEKYIEVNQEDSSRAIIHRGAQIAISINRSSGNSIVRRAYSFREFAPVPVDQSAIVEV